MSTSGVYQVLCQSTGHRYIGSSLDVYADWEQMKTSLNKGKHDNKVLQYAWSLFEESGFEFSVLEEVAEESLKSRESHYLLNIKPEFNILASRLDKTTKDRSTKKVMTSLRVDPSTLQAIKQFCIKERISQTEFMDRAIMFYLTWFHTTQSLNEGSNTI